MKNFYETLGLSAAATQDEIKISYRKLAVKFHPDKHGGDLFFLERFKEIQEAYQMLSDIEKRRKFDIKWNAFYDQKNHEPVDSNDIINYPIVIDYSNSKIIIALVIITGITIASLAFLV